jgi:hypothetical protein
MTDLPDVKLKCLVSFPATIIDGAGIDVTRLNGSFKFDLAYDDFTPPLATISDPTHTVMLVWNTVSQQYGLAPTALLLGAGSTFPSGTIPIMDGTAATGVETLYSRGDHVHPTDSSRAPIASPTFTGDPKAPTPSPGDNDTSIATTAFVTAAVAGGGAVPAALTRTNDTNVTLTLGGTPATALLQASSITAGWTGTLATGRGGWGIDISASSGVPIFTTGAPTFTGTNGTGNIVLTSSPTFTGDPKAPTPTAGDNDTSIATTAFVTSAVSTGLSGSGFAPLAAPIFTGDARAVTPTAGDNDTSIATTAFVTTAVSNGTSGLAPLASPIFTGDARAVTPTAGDNDTSIATTAFVTSALPVAATAAEYVSNSAPTKMLTPGAPWSAATPVALSGTSVTPDLSAGIDFTWTMSSATSTLVNPTSPKPGQKGMLYLKQDGTGGRIITTWGSSYKFPGGVKPTLSTAANALDVISFAVKSSTEVECFFAAGMA